MADTCCIEGCGAWIGRANQTVCIDCKRKLKKVPLIKCRYPSCTTYFPKGRNRELCLEHTARP